MKRAVNERGFSLVEIMIVVAIIGLMASVVVLSLPSRSTELRQSVQRTEQVLVALSRRSVLSGRIVGVTFTETGLSALALTDDGWVVDSAMLHGGVFQWEPVSLIGVKVEGTDQSVGAEQATPHIWYLPTGEHPAFELSFAGQAGSAQLSAGISSPIKVTYDEAD